MHNYTYSRIENGDIDDDEDDLDIEDMKDDDDAGDCDTHWSKTAWHLHCSCYCSCNLGWVNKSTIPPSLFSLLCSYILKSYHTIILSVQFWNIPGIYSKLLIISSQFYEPVSTPHSTLIEAISMLKGVPN